MRISPENYRRVRKLSSALHLKIIHTFLGQISLDVAQDRETYV
jgi:hypothetical protein